MEENYMATSRNGHELKDMYNPETNTLDIRSNGLYPSNVLSNLCSNCFRLVPFASTIEESLPYYRISVHQVSLKANG
jgi:hypothetical protein